jgi:hypothetical protein
MQANTPRTERESEQVAPELHRATPEEVRGRLEQLALIHDRSLAELSRMLGRNVAYLQQFVRRGTPVRLDEDDRLRLAQLFKVDERELGAREPWTPHR